MKDAPNFGNDESGWNERVLSFLPLFLTALYIPVFLIIHAINKLAIIYYGDSNSHAVIARSLFDSSDAITIGTTWLPIYHFLLAPFCFFDALYFTYASGFLLNLIMVFASFYFLDKLLKSLCLNAEIRIAALLLLALNPDFVYLAMTPMTEVTFIAFLIIAAYYYQQAITSLNRRDMLLASLFICLLTLIRYEAWFLAPLPFLHTLKTIRNEKLFSTKTQHRLLLSCTAFTGILFWLLYHIVFYGGAFRFLQSTKSAGYEPAGDLVRFSITGVLAAFGINFIQIYGPILTLLTLILLGSFLLHKMKAPHCAGLLLFLSAPTVYLLFSLFFGYVQIKDHWNSRYVLSAMPFVIVAGAIGLRNADKKLIHIAVFLGLCYYVLQGAAVLPITTFADAQTHIYDRTYEAQRIGNYIADSLGNNKVCYVGGNANASHRMMLFARIPLKQFQVFRLSDSTSEAYTIEEYKNPWKYYRIIILEYKLAGYGGAEIPVIEQKIAEVARHARLVQKTGYFAVFNVK